MTTRTTRWAISLSAVAAVGGLVWYALIREPPEKPVEVATARAHRTKLIRKITGVGHVEPVTQVRVSSNVSGDLLSLEVKEGQLVHRGDFLAEIDPARMAAVVRQQDATVKSSEAEVQLNAARLAQSKLEFHRTEELHKDKLATDAEFDRAQSDLGVLEAQLEGARQRVAQSRAALDEAKARLIQSRILSPVDGTVLSVEHKVGERIRGSDLSEDVLLVVAPLIAMQVQVEVSEQDITKVGAGMMAEAAVDALGGLKITGRVVEIGNNAVIKNRGTESETTSFKVKIALENLPAQLRSGMSCAMGILVETKDNVIAIPIEAVTARLPRELEPKSDDERRKIRAKLAKGGSADDDEDKNEQEKTRTIKPKERPVRIVFAVEDGKAEAKKLNTGITSDAEIEVLDGVAEGAELVVGPYRALSKLLIPGTPVKVIETAAPPPSSAATPVAAEQPRAR